MKMRENRIVKMNTGTDVVTLPRVLIAGTKSGCGKTLLTTILMQMLLERGERPALFKCGPDYLDPLFHKALCGDIAVGNLDAFFMDEAALCGAMMRGCENSTMALIEGVMGYYDGIGGEAFGSSAAISNMTKTPVILLLDGYGRATSILAELYGFLRFHPYGTQIRGVILNRTSPQMYPMLAREIEKMGVAAIGFLPVKKEMEFPSRHLGLLTPDDEESIAARALVRKLAAEFSETIDLAAVMRISHKVETISATDETSSAADGGNNRETVADADHGITANGKNAAKKPRIAVSRDKAFCFLYRESLAALERAGFEIRFFSPLSDKELPDCDALYLCGGYPEWHAKELEENTSMRHSVRNAIQNGLPTIAECGGFLYLHDGLVTADDKRYEMAGALSGDCRFANRLHPHFGYVTLHTENDGRIFSKHTPLYAHEFHYFVSENEGADLLAEKPNREKPAYRTGHLTDTLYAGFPHLPFFGYNEKTVAGRLWEMA